MKYALFVVLSLSVLLVSCSGSKTQNNIAQPYVGGTAGLGISFVQGAPPSEIYNNGKMPFSVIVQLQNLGESDVGANPTNSQNTFADVQIIGINPEQFGSPVMEQTLSSAGVTVLGSRKNFDGSVVAGTPNIVQFQGFNYLPATTGNQQVTIRANVCYDYQTKSNTQICVKDNVLENSQDTSICTISGPRDVQDSGAPVHVTSASENPLGTDQIQVTFTIENVGKGLIFRQGGGQSTGTTGVCDTSLTNPDRNVVHVRAYLGDVGMSSATVVSCPLLGNTNEGDIQLFGGAAVTMSCSLTVNPTGNRVYTDVLHVDLTYSYLDYTEVPILIRDITLGAAQ